MKVWAVIYGDDWQSGHWFYGVYTTLEQAQAALQELQKLRPYEDEDCYISERTLNSIWDKPNGDWGRCP